MSGLSRYCMSGQRALGAGWGAPMVFGCRRWVARSSLCAILRRSLFGDIILPRALVLRHGMSHLVAIGDGGDVAPRVLRRAPSLTGAETAAPAQARRRPHQKDVYLHWSAEKRRWVIINTTTQELKELPQVEGHSGIMGEYMLHFEADGFGLITRGDGVWAEDLDNLFSDLSFEDAMGNIYMEIADESGARIVVSLWEVQTRFQYYKASVDAGVADADLSFQVAIFERPRPDGCRIAWSLLHMHKSLKLNSFAGQSWKWVNKQLPTCERLARDFNLGCICKGAQHKGTPGKDAEPDRTLAHTSVTTCLFFAMLARMLTPSKQTGGLDDEAGRVSVRAVLSGCICAAIPEELSLTLFRDEGACNGVYPTPAEGVLPFTLALLPGGFCELDGDFGDDGAHWLASSGLVVGRILVVDLLARLADSRKKSIGLFRQVLRKLGALFEAVVMADPKSRQARLSLDEDGPDRSHDVQLERQLVKHTLAAKAACARNMGMLSIACDKSRVGSYGLQDCCGVLWTNEAFVMPPTVVCVSSGGALWRGVRGPTE